MKFEVPIPLYYFSKAKLFDKTDKIEIHGLVLFLGSKELSSLPLLSLLRLFSGKLLGNIIPIDVIKEKLDEIRASVSVVDIISVFPNIDDQ